MLAVYMRWKFEAPNHDVADAYTLARLAAHLDPELHVESPELKFSRRYSTRCAGRRSLPAPSVPLDRPTTALS
ncbi:hypothetical protein ABZY10_16715 [Streptomyces sp. NPDC006539]|uniref:hypothetical protein n=1 Tax=Streptomyces TaxID=1883 RepID=UPI003391FA64|nr:hypothetical protein OG987_28335 [Streptomyces sp. NBC_01620]